MTIKATVQGAERGRHLAFSSPLRMWHGVNVSEITKVIVDPCMMSLTDREGHHVHNMETDPNCEPVTVTEMEGTKRLGKFEITDKTVNGLEIPIGHVAPSASGAIIFERTS